MKSVEEATERQKTQRLLSMHLQITHAWMHTDMYINYIYSCFDIHDQLIHHAEYNPETYSYAYISYFSVESLRFPFVGFMNKLEMWRWIESCVGKAANRRLGLRTPTWELGSDILYLNFCTKILPWFMMHITIFYNDYRWNILLSEFYAKLLVQATLSCQEVLLLLLLVTRRNWHYSKVCTK